MSEESFNAVAERAVAAAYREGYEAGKRTQEDYRFKYDALLKIHNETTQSLGVYAKFPREALREAAAPLRETLALLAALEKSYEVLEIPE